MSAHSANCLPPLQAQYPRATLHWPQLRDMSLPNVQDLYELQKLAGDADMSEMDLTDLRRAFDAFDQDRNGSIDRAELGR